MYILYTSTMYNIIHTDINYTHIQISGRDLCIAGGKKEARVICARSAVFCKFRRAGDRGRGG